MGALIGNNQISTLLALGADAMDNMFDIAISPPVGLTTLENIGIGRGAGTGVGNPEFVQNLTIRASGFEPPVFNPKTYEVKYKTVTLDRPATKIEGKREFNIEFRLDANYQAYRFLAAWRSLVMQPSSGYATNALWDEKGDQGLGGDVNKLFGTVSVNALARPVYMSDGSPFDAEGVTGGKFTDDALKNVGDGTTAPISANLTKWEFKQVWITSLSEPGYKTDGGDPIKIKATFKFGEFVDPIYSQFGNV